MIKRILVPIDFSDCSYNALRYATLLAEKLSVQEMVILHAYSAPLSYADLNISYDLTYTATAIENEIEADFDKLETKVPELKGIKYKMVKRDAYLDEAVLKVCLAHQIDLIVMGTQGASGIDQVVLGTNTHRIINEQICPVLVVPENATFHPIKNIALSSDYKGIMSELLHPLKAIRHAFASDVHVIHISEKSVLEKEKAAEAKNLELYLKDLPHQYHFLVAEDIELALEDFAKTNHIELLVVYPRKKGLFQRIFGKSESKSIIFHTRIPLLALSPYKKTKH
ncbi:universal stress protein [Marivirga sp. S37H4]|uniref:Universal stress protein n=1 Tax=Marivirga aurantiaca TaxID=2802615 RepID=A0A934WWZ2_9BACT|nr:universal stress protein [Marivirga aurantiaca]MBK6264456.1 universal stress protein [Marivirga aurantiaca]